MDEVAISFLLLIFALRHQNYSDQKNFVMNITTINIQLNSSGECVFWVYLKIGRGKRLSILKNNFMLKYRMKR